MKIIGYETIVRYHIEFGDHDVLQLKANGQLPPDAGSDGPVILPITMDELRLACDALGYSDEERGALAAQATVVPERQIETRLGRRRSLP